MPQHPANIREWRALAQHVDGKRMTKLMRTSRGKFHSGTSDRTSDDLAYIATRPQTIERRAGAQEHPAARRFRSPAFEIGRDRLDRKSTR